jgi:outer membrane protein TolC
MPHAQANSTLTVVRSAKSNIFFQPLARKNLCHLSAFAFCFLGILTLFASFSQAQELSFSQALDMASIRATTLQNLRQEEQLARATATRSTQAFLPRLSADSTWVRGDIDALGHIPAINLRTIPPEITTADYGPAEGLISSINIVQPLVHVEGWLGHTQARNAVKARSAASEWGRQVLKLQTAWAYFNVQIQDGILRAAQQTLQASRHGLEIARGHYAEGMVSKLDVTRARADLQSARAQVYAAEAQIGKARNELASLLGLNPVDPVRITTPLPLPLPPSEYPLPHQQRADIDASRFKVQAATTGVEKARARILPQVNLLGRQQWVNGDQALDDYGDGWLLGVNLNWEIFEGMDRAGEIAQARAREHLAQIEATDMQRSALEQQRNSLADWKASWSAWQASRAAVDAAASAADLAQRRYAEGLGAINDVLLTRADLYQHQVRKFRYQFNALLAGMSYYLYHGYSPLQGLPPQLRLPETGESKTYPKRDTGVSSPSIHTNSYSL